MGLSIKMFALALLATLAVSIVIGYIYGHRELSEYEYNVVYGLVNDMGSTGAFLADYLPGRGKLSDYSSYMVNIFGYGEKIAISFSTRVNVVKAVKYLVEGGRYEAVTIYVDVVGGQPSDTCVMIGPFEKDTLLFVAYVNKTAIRIVNVGVVMNSSKIVEFLGRVIDENGNPVPKKPITVYYSTVNNASLILGSANVTSIIFSDSKGFFRTRLPLEALPEKAFITLAVTKDPGYSKGYVVVNATAANVFKDLTLVVKHD